MAILQVNPNRMELARLKGRLVTATRGHKLMKDKRDDLMKKFLRRAAENMDLRAELEEKMRDVYRGFVIAGAVMEEVVLQEALMLPAGTAAVDVETTDLMNIRVPEFHLSSMAEHERSIYPYGFAFTSAELDDSVRALNEAVPLMIRLAESEKTVQLMADEIERTRRRVNGLEYVQIPALQETIKSITMRLEENERGNLARLMKVKDMMIARQRGEKENV